ncbi:type I-D CRISPR-associated protein Cas7/Csc2 [Methylacidiphilum caldifontis]|uniref:type I-D CRISPR-associated protein Cas7/Csc2 n=1 Tax=Methylacidiphilum caldifontis TaxID=2795386 RepID=UPI001A907B69|nr:type I-D CRISPR-associated protein Cas7/Csc2 [Methylacidiphilum caldifontis]QSR87924.1 type I-D CRISPR-associated protein Cas7/Csc2 [Methylacidiphilum caldifontis]
MIQVLQNYKDFLLDSYSNLPLGKYISIVLVRETQGETIFRTEGSGEPLNREFVLAGMDHNEPIQRIIISKRKQTAVERRTGREFLRSYGLLSLNGKECMLNTNEPCERCVDCWLYGYAVGGGGAQKSRVITEEAFSLLPAGQIVDRKTFNALFDNSTMRHPKTGEPSASLGSSEYVKPESQFIDIETLKDVTEAEFVYVLANILNSKRYGAISSKIGRIDNHIVGIIFSNSEIFSTLELTQRTYDLLKADLNELDHPLNTQIVITKTREAISHLLPSIIGRKVQMKEEEIRNLVFEVNRIYEEPKQFLINLTNSYPEMKK